MTGSIEHMSLSEARKDSTSDQARLSSFSDTGSSDTAYIGIVNSSSDDFDSVVDEMEPALSPPDDLFYQWLNLRKSFQDDLPKLQAHHKALEEVNYRSRFGQYLDSSDEAQRAIDRLSARVMNGEHIVLVCYCSDAMWCHRDPVAETVKALVEQQIHT